MSKGSEPAYPVSETVGERGDYRDVLAGGLTKREAFAMAAMQGLCAAGFATDPRTASQLARQHADALLAELAKEREDEQ